MSQASDATSTVAPPEPQIGFIVREREPLNLEWPFDQLDTFLTPNDQFYIRSHYPAPVLDRHDYRLSIGGAVERPFTISYEELLAMPSVTRPATLECAGNGRVFLSPQVKGAQWQLGAVSTAEWTGVPLTALLERAGIAANACEILFEAADAGTPKEEPIPPGNTSYSRSQVAYAHSRAYRTLQRLLANLRLRLLGLRREQEPDAPCTGPDGRQVRHRPPAYP